MTIAIVIATYNRAALLAECLEQLRRQAFAPGDEVIVVDNASTDGTPDVIHEAARRFPVPLRYVRETAPGKTPALTAGIAASASDVVALTDDDVLVGDDWIATVRRLFEDASLSLAGGRVDPRWEKPAPAWVGNAVTDTYGRMMSPLALVNYGPAQDLGTRTAVGANMAVRRRVLNDLGGFAPHLGRMRGTLLCGEDHDLCQRAQGAGYRCEYRPELRVRHWVPAERVTLRYYVRWFASSGMTNALLDPNRTRQTAYLLKRLGFAAAGALWGMMTFRREHAAERLMDAAFCAGYLWESLKLRRQEARVSRRQAPQLPASTQPPAIPLPDQKAGKVV